MERPHLDKFSRVDAERFADQYLKRLSTLLGNADIDAIAGFIELLLDARRRDATVFFVGNGGSAATASHFANDIAIGSRTRDGVPFRALSLTDNVAVMTALANDEGYDRIFVDQLRVQMRDGDMLVAISASGHSPNIVAAVEYAQSRGSTVIGLTGFDGGRLRRLADLSIHLATDKGEYGPVEDFHMIVDHLVGAFLTRWVRDTDAG